MIRIVTRTATFVVCLLSLAAAQTPTQPNTATLLKTTYYKFAYLVSMNPAVEAALKAHSGIPVDDHEVARKLDANKLEVTLSNIKTGPVEQVLGKTWGSVDDVPWAPQEVLEVNVNSDDFQDFDQPKVSWQVATAKWIPADPRPPESLADAMLNKLTVKETLVAETQRLKSTLAWTQYATYTVTLRYGGKSVTYKTICFLADNNGVTQAMPEDNFLRANLFGMGGSLDVFPVALLHSSLSHEYAPLQQWLRSHTVDAQDCHTGGVEFCCSGDSCGIASTDLEHELSQPAGRKP